MFGTLSNDPIPSGTCGMAPRVAPLFVPTLLGVRVSNLGAKS